MIPVDLHCHSHFSGCGLHSIIELLQRAKSQGMKGLAITDHGPEAGGRITNSAFERLFDPLSGIRYLKGIEANPKGLDGSLDIPESIIPHLDIGLVGLHWTVKRGLGKKGYTKLLLKIIEKNPCIDVITHPSFDGYDIDLDTIARTCQERGIALELNNSKLHWNKMDPSGMDHIIEACMKHSCLMVVSSDAHALNEVGCDDMIRPLIKKHQIPKKLFVNLDAKRAFKFIEERKKNKRK